MCLSGGGGGGVSVSQTGCQFFITYLLETVELVGINRGFHFESWVKYSIKHWLGRRSNKSETKIALSKEEGIPSDTSSRRAWIVVFVFGTRGSNVNWLGLKNQMQTNSLEFKGSAWMKRKFLFLVYGLFKWKYSTVLNVLWVINKFHIKTCQMFHKWAPRHNFVCSTSSHQLSGLMKCLRNDGDMKKYSIGMGSVPSSASGYLGSRIFHLFSRVTQRFDLEGTCEQNRADCFQLFRDECILVSDKSPEMDSEIWKHFQCKKLVWSRQPWGQAGVNSLVIELLLYASLRWS